MKKNCIQIRKWLKQAGIEPADGQSRAEIEKHLAGCASCRDFAAYLGFLSALHQSRAQQTTKPSGQFYFNLKQRLADQPGLSQKPFSVSLVRMGWKLAPAMAVVAALALTSISISYRATDAVFIQSALDEELLFEEESLSDNTILGSIFIEEDINGK